MSTGAALNSAPAAERQSLNLKRFFHAVLAILAETGALREHHRSQNPSLEW